MHLKRAPWLLVLGIVAWSADASAFCRSTTCRGNCPTDKDSCPSTGQKLFWPQTCVGYSLQKDGTQSLDINDVRVTIQKCFQAWSDMPCPDADGKYASMTFSELEDVSCKKVEYNKDGPNVNVVFFKDDDWTYKGIDGTLATTSVTYDDRTGEIYDADMAINAAFNDVTVSDTKIGYDLQSIVTHEVGHFIGLAHSPNADATMYASYARGTTGPRKLSDDDIAAVCTVYPPGRLGACDATPRNGLGKTCGDDPVGGKTGCTVAGDSFRAGPRAGAAGPSELAGIAILGALVVTRRKKKPS
jgi:hypothetical protein